VADIVGDAGKLLATIRIASAKNGENAHVEITVKGTTPELPINAGETTPAVTSSSREHSTSW
jgi:hypothetical protein